MTKEQYVQRVFDARLRMCEEVMGITNDYVCEHASEIPEVSTDGLYLEYDKKNPADVHLSFSVRLSCDFPNIRPLKIIPVMTKEEYIARLEEIKKKCQKEVNELGVEYAKSNNPHQVGDTIKDHMGAMVIERVQPVLSAFVQILYNIPVCRYYGVQLKKDGKPMKRQDPTRSIHQLNIIEPK